MDDRHRSRAANDLEYSERGPEAPGSSGASGQESVVATAVSVCRMIPGMTRVESTSSGSRSVP
jgi:hypothetical protein